MHHGRRHEMQSMLAQTQRIPLLDDHAVIRKILAKEVLHHDEGLGGGYQNSVWIGLEEVDNVGGVIRLHVLNDEEIGSTTVQNSLDIIQPLVSKPRVNSIHDGDPIGDNVLSLEKIHGMVVDTDVTDIIRNIHNKAPSQSEIAAVRLCGYYNIFSGICKYPLP